MYAGILTVLLSISQTAVLLLQTLPCGNESSDSQDHMISAAELDASVDYIQNHSEIHDVLVTGGDALTLSDAQLQQLLCRIRAIPHVKIIRLGSRMPVNLPKRITEDLVQILKQYAPIYINTQFNHPLEVTPKHSMPVKLLADSGIVLGNQMVLLREINNDKYIVQCLNDYNIPLYLSHTIVKIHGKDRVNGITVAKVDEKMRPIPVRNLISTVIPSFYP